MSTMPPDNIPYLQHTGHREDEGTPAIRAKPAHQPESVNVAAAPEEPGGPAAPPQLIN
jgi:hypothetical protein